MRNKIYILLFSLIPVLSLDLIGQETVTYVTSELEPRSYVIEESDDTVVYYTDEVSDSSNYIVLDDNYTTGPVISTRTYDTIDDLDSLRAEIGKQIEIAQTMGPISSYEDLNIDTLRLLVYLHAKLGNHLKAREVSDIIFAKAPNDKQTLYALLSMHFEDQNASEALALSQRLNRLYPNDGQILYYLGQAYYMNGLYKEANSILSTLPDYQFDNALYPQEFDVVERAFLSNEWAYGANMLLQALETHQDLEFDISFEQKERLQQIFYKRLGHVGAKFTSKIFDQGTVFSTQLSGGLQVNDRYKVYGEVDIPITHLEATDLWRDSSKSFFQGIVGLQYNRNKYEANLFAGAHQDGGMFGGSITRNFDYGKSVSIDGFYGKRSEDTLLLERLNARTSGAGIFGQYSFDDDHKSYLNGRFEGRKIGVDGTDLSTAYGIYFNADRLITPAIEQLRWGYRANYISYSDVNAPTSIINDIALPGLTAAQRQTIVQNSLPDSVHRHGLFLSWKDYLNKDFSYRGMVGYDYDLEQSGGLYYVTAGMTYYINNKTRIMLDLGYFSDPNIGIAGSDLWQAMVAFQMGL